MLLLIPALIIITAYGASISGQYTRHLRHYISKALYNLRWKEPWDTLTPIKILIASSVIIGGGLIFVELPGKNFYNGGAFIGYRQIYKHMVQQNFSKNSTVVFTIPESLVYANLGLHLLTDEIPKFTSFGDRGFRDPYKLEDAKEKLYQIDYELKKNSDKVFYCFLQWTNNLGVNRVIDGFFKDHLLKLYPKATPFVVNGLDGKPLWHVVTVSKQLKH